MSPIYVFAVRCTVEPKNRDAFVEAVNAHAARSLRDEVGTLRFDVAIDRDDPARVYLFEGYRDEAAFQAHFTAMEAGPQPWSAYVTAPAERMCIGWVVPPPVEIP